VTVSWFLLLSFGIAAVTIEQFIHLCSTDFVSKNARPPLITQDGNSFTGIRLKDNPSPARGLAGSKSLQGEVDKSGIKKLDIIGGGGEVMPSKWQISENGNKINVDAP
jgi:hypothetical protein